MPHRNSLAALVLLGALLLPATPFTGVNGAAAQSETGEAASPRFVAGLEDLPLMPGLNELTGSGFAFDSATGRIVEAYATGDLAQQQVLDFYAETLPQLGWEQASPRGFKREGERLSIEFVKGGNPLTVRFSLAPE
ncbi:MAG: hypothetical protein AB7V53_05285 [Dongiaceae bacterium]